MTPDYIAIAVAVLAIGLQVGDLRGQRRAERHSESERLQALTTEYLAAIGSLQGALVGHRQAWESNQPKTVTIFHAAAAALAQKGLIRGLAAAAPITYSFYTASLHSTLLLSGPLARVGTVWAQLRQEEDQHLAAAANTLYEAVSTVAAQPSESNQARLDDALKAFADEARRAAREARLPRWRVRGANWLLRKGKK